MESRCPFEMVPGGVFGKAVAGHAGDIERDINPAGRPAILLHPCGGDAVASECGQRVIAKWIVTETAYHHDLGGISRQFRNTAGSVGRRPAETRAIWKHVPEDLTEPNHMERHRTHHGEVDHKPHHAPRL